MDVLRSICLNKLTAIYLDLVSRFVSRQRSLFFFGLILLTVTQKEQDVYEVRKKKTLNINIFTGHKRLLKIISNLPLKCEGVIIYLAFNFMRLLMCISIVQNVDCKNKQCVSLQVYKVGGKHK